MFYLRELPWNGDSRATPCRCRVLIGSVVVVLGAAALVALSLAGNAQPQDPPDLIFDESVASDFQSLAEETWAEFLDVFQARTYCFGDIRLRAAYDLNSRGAYDPASAVVTVRVPGTRAMLQSALVHEWAHHVEFQCEAHRELREAFLLAQGLPPDTPWRPDYTPEWGFQGYSPATTPNSAWAGIPSEQYAEATVELVLGSRPILTQVRVSREALRVVEEWAAGD